MGKRTIMPRAIMTRAMMTHNIMSGSLRDLKSDRGWGGRLGGVMLFSCDLMRLFSGTERGCVGELWREKYKERWRGS